MSETTAHEAIRQLFARAAQAGDARKADAYAACFTADGVLALDPVIEGREAIRAWMGGATIIPQRSDRPAGFVSHHLTTCAITLETPTHARARTYWLVTSPVGLDHNGYYDDVLRCVGGEWLLAHRRPRTLWFAPDSLVRP
jgi:hypothetical protein